MDIVEINRFTQNKKVMNARNEMFQSRKHMHKDNALCLILYACKKMYGLNYTALLIHSIGVDKIDLSS